MTEIIDESMTASRYGYATFWERTGAYIIDLIIVSVVTLPLLYINMMNWKDYSIYLVILLVQVMYRPFFEYSYGATPGKMALKLQVLGYDFRKINLMQAILRNLNYSLLSFADIPVMYMLFNSPGFEEATGFFELQRMQEDMPGRTMLGIAVFIVVITDIVLLLTDKQRRTLHDRMGSTVVAKVPDSATPSE